MKSIGYRQILAYFQGAYDRETAIDKIKQATRNFAKRQITWYKRMPYIHWLEIQEAVPRKFYVKEMLETLHKTEE
jgi:tRNA dimethylallyltransferase